MGPTPSIKLISIIGMFSFLLHDYCHGSSVIKGARDVELENQLRVLNKTPIKTIQTEIGDVVDCIDINKQPSLDHPILNNHVIKTRPISHSTKTMVDDNHHEALDSSSSSSPPSFSFVKPSNKISILRKLGCPDGTVPIRRTSKKDLIRAESFSKSQLLSSINNVGDQVDDLENPDQSEFLSIAKTREYSGVRYFGIQGRINVYNPTVVENQVSSGQLWIESGSLHEEFNSLQAGWMIAPSLFGDNRTRTFAKWQVHGSNRREGCYNILCPGFIQVDKDHFLGDAIPTSHFGSQTQYEIKVSIHKDDGGNWWLDIEDTKIGYWPSELGFSQLTRGSPVIAWGGLAAQLGGVATVPPTGNGHFPYYSWLYLDFHRMCFIRHMKVMPVRTLNWEDPKKQIIDTFATNRKCSKVFYYGNIDHGAVLQHVLTFGGPGGYCSQF